MHLRLLLPIIIGGFAGLCHAQDFCAYKDSDQLAWDPAFAKSIDSFFGTREGTLFMRNKRIAAQIRAGIGGGPYDLQPLSHGLALVQSCRPHSCREKVAVVLQCPNSIVAIAAIHFPCLWERRGPDCLGRADLTMFFSKLNQEQLGRVAIEQWGRAAAAEDNETLTVELRSQSGATITPRVRPP
jgi:hypothetical protein